MPVIRLLPLILVAAVVSVYTRDLRLYLRRCLRHDRPIVLSECWRAFLKPFLKRGRRR